MTSEKLKEILQKGEGIDAEYKTSQFELNKDVFDSICAFLNRTGGHLLLGVKNDGTVEGVIEGCVQDIVSNMVTNANNIIETDRVLTENWNPPHYGGVINPDNFSPYPKNPVIAKFFKEIGRVDELGSGVRNTFKYCGIYTPGKHPEFIEEDVFRAIIPLKAKEKEEAVSASDWNEVRRKVRSKFGEKFGEKLVIEDDYGRITEEIRKKSLHGCSWNRKSPWKKSHRE